ncbi:hypothetical protein C8R47DRAFT_1144247 [Mycena vitilis]|nr:hypothetical protein C8R47DRAFT_1144247 [Mycena vitilis]
MARWLMSALAAGWFLALSSIVATESKSVYPQPGPAAASFFAVCEALVRGYAALVLSLTLAVLCALGKSLCTSRPAAGPITLEDGSTESDSESSELPPDTAMMDVLVPPPSLLGKLSCLAMFTYALAQQWAAGDVVSLQRPLRENVLGAALYIMRRISWVHLTVKSHSH